MIQISVTVEYNLVDAGIDSALGDLLAYES